jgi:hypothetical protein
MFIRGKFLDSFGGGLEEGRVSHPLVLLFVPFRQGILWARWAIPAGGLVNTAGILYAMLFVGFKTPANPPWIAPLAGAVLLVAGFLFSLEQPKAIGA